jgi:hypothetical protein
MTLFYRSFLVTWMKMLRPEVLRLQPLFHVISQQHDGAIAHPRELHVQGIGFPGHHSKPFVVSRGWDQCIWDASWNELRKAISAREGVLPNAQVIAQKQARGRIDYAVAIGHLGPPIS